MANVDARQVTADGQRMRFWWTGEHHDCAGHAILASKGLAQAVHRTALGSWRRVFLVQGFSVVKT